jgi:aminopeptidase N
MHHARCGSISLMATPRPFSTSATPRVYERSRPFKVSHLFLELELDVKKKEVHGTATLDVERIDAGATELSLDGVGFEIARIDFEGKKRRAATFSYDGETIRIPIGPDVRSAKVRITYSATPKRGLYFLEPDEHVQDRPQQVWTQCQDEDARHWFPCHDKPHVKMTFELVVKVPRGWRALSNGALVRREEKPNATHWQYHWRMPDPLPSYLVTLVAGEFSEIDGGKAAGVPVTYWVPKGREEEGRRAFGRTPEMIEHFGKLLGVPYPWNKYAQIVVSDFIFGGMENTTATTMYEHVLIDERAGIDVTSDDIVAHELAHQWFGDFVTCRDWSHGWLNEGFATLFEHIDIEHKLGKDDYDYSLAGDLAAYFAEANGRYRRPIVCQDYDAPIDIFDRHLYQKGGIVLHMLRVMLGDSTFWGGVRAYLTKHARSIVETRDLERALEDHSGKSLEQFFEQWVFRAGHPEIEVKVEHDDGVLTVHVKQTQKIDKETPAFVVPFTFEVSSGGKAVRHTRTIGAAAETIALPCPERPKFVTVDPDFAVLADVKVDAPLDMLRNQLAMAKPARARWLAADALAKRGDPPALKALQAALENEAEFWGVRKEAALALGHVRGADAFEILKKNARTSHPKVRRGVVQALGQFRTAAAAEALKPLALQDESYLVESEAARSLGKTRQTGAFDTLVEVLDRPAWADMVRVGALDGLAALRDDRAVSHALARSRYGVKTRGRQAAILALGKLTADRKHREALEELLDDPNPMIRGDVVRAIAEMADGKSRAALSGHLERENDGRVRRRIREALQELAGRGRERETELRDELDKLRVEQAELKGRLSKLEAKRGAEPKAAKGAPKSAGKGKTSKRA